MQELIRILKMLIEMAVFAVIIYIALRFLRQTRGSGVVRGLALILMVGVVAFIILIQTLHLDRLAYLFNIVGQSVVLGSIVVFQPEIRRGIVHLGDSPIFGRFFRTDSKIVHRLLRSVARMSKERMGALIALEREASLAAMAETGITIDAELNSFLIESIFYPKSALHDGAIVVRDDRIVAASCLLPLSQNPDIDKRLGTRHRAALGLAEETDAVAVVVSEETGKVSAALGGQLHYDLTLEQLEQLLEESTRAAGAGLSRADKRRSSSWATLVSDPYRKLAAIALAAGLWVFLDKQVDDKTSFVLQLREVDESRLSQYEGVGNELLVLLPKKTVLV
ncbi:MAG TPA: diadenylate cyclase CdaA, partial [Planctomycetota bacterium]|nr:diadenylate cyclase CdaA [Planctomycetota bacterium]